MIAAFRNSGYHREFSLPTELPNIVSNLEFLKGCGQKRTSSPWPPPGPGDDGDDDVVVALASEDFSILATSQLDPG